MTELYMIIICFSAAFTSFIGTYAIMKLCETFGKSSHPNERDNHAGAIPKGAGLAVMISLVSFLCVVGTNGYVLAALLILTVVSAIDDYRGLSVKIRLLFQLISSAIIIFQLDAQIIPSISYIIEYIILTIALTWFINIYNFMDGIDEITASQTTMISIGLIAIAALVPQIYNGIAYDSLVIISAITGFWYFNRHPAKVFLGDSGSIPLGALIGWLLLSLASKGFWIEALMLPAYYLLDTAITFIKRLISGKKIWLAHSQHAYQNYVRSGKSHITTVRILTLYNILVLVILTANLYMPHFKIIALAAIYVIALIIYIYFSTRNVKGKNHNNNIIIQNAIS